AAILCLIYNIGAGNFKASTLLTKLNSNAPLAEIEKEWLKWVHVKKKVVQGLVNRRKKEFELFSKDYINYAK
ncbi:MAG: hypothetical protein LBQ34_02905, partial [Alphaproteobacteria bacterium]|nr:hypothetical protein [Alphaproteobacteria bacterium]